MAPAGESAYFPHLEKCFSGETELISWKTAFAGLSDRDMRQRGDKLQDFLYDQSVVDLLAKPFELYESPSSQTKAAFETKTAAINVTPASHGQYDINEIKEDSLSLSKLVGIDEVAALRIVILEWQDRPSVQLFQGFAEEETASIQDASGVENLRSSVGGARLSTLLATIGAQTSQTSEFHSTRNRQTRQLDIYLSERRHALKVSQMLITAALKWKWADGEPPQDGDTSKGKYRQDWIERVGKSICERQRKLLQAESGADLQLAFVNGIESRLTGLEVGSGWFEQEGGREDAEDAWATNMIEEMIHILHILLGYLHCSRDITTSRAVLTWFRIMSRTRFFEAFKPASDRQKAVTLPFQTLVAVVSLAMVKLQASIHYLVDPSARQVSVDSSEKPYFADLDALPEICELLLNAAGACITAASPAVLAWTMILQTLRMIALEEKEQRETLQSQRAIEDFSSPSDDSPTSTKSALRPSTSRSGSLLPPSRYEELFEATRISSEEDTITYMARCSIDECQVFDAVPVLCENLCTLEDPDFVHETHQWARLDLLDLLQNALDFLDYIPELVSATLSVITPQTSFSRGRSLNQGRDPRTTFMNNPDLMRKLLKVSQSRFPFEALPFLKLCKALSSELDEGGTPVIASILRDMTTYTQKNPMNFSGYQTTREEENENFVLLNQTLNMFSTHNPRRLAITDGSQTGRQAPDPYCLPAGTIGRVVSDSRPAVVMWSYEYSGLAYLGRWLEMLLTKDIVTVSEPLEDIALEIVALLTSLLHACCDPSAGKGNFEEARKVLESASDGIDRSGDIISVVMGIFEQEIQLVTNPSSIDRPLDLTIACLRFMDVLILVLPGRVWPFLARSTFLGIEGRGGMLGTIISSREVPSATFDFLVSSIRMFASLVDDAAVRAVARRTSAPTNNRQLNTKLSYAGTPTRVMRKVIHVFGLTLIEVYESSATWRFNDDLQRLEMNTFIGISFCQIIEYAYRIDDVHDLESKVTGAFSTIAPSLLEFFLSQSPRDLTFNPLLRVLFDGVSTPQSTLFLKANSLWRKQVVSVMALSFILVRAGRFLGLPASSLEMQLFKASPLMVRLYVANYQYRKPVLILLESLVKDAVREDGDPPSLLGNLGITTARDFGDCLASFDRPLHDVELEIRVWNFLSALVSNKQQWIAIVLLTGSSPRATLKEKDVSREGTMRGKPFLTKAVDLLRDIHALQHTHAIAVLEFVALAQEYWPWAVADFKAYPWFITSLLDYMSKIEYQTDSMLDNCYTAKIASLICDILAVYIHHSRGSGTDFAFRQRTEIKDALPWLVEHGARATGYNVSLHRTLEKNLEDRYNGCKLVCFKRTTLEKHDFGGEFFYDLKLAGELLCYDPAWKGRQNDGFEDEFIRANVNLSKFEAQLQLLHSWKFLAGELCLDLIQDKPFQDMMVDVVTGCLDANLRTDSPQAIFNSLVQTRASFALEIVQHLAASQPRLKESQKLQMLKLCVGAIRNAGGNFGSVLLNETLEYYRLLLKILFIALQFVAGGTPKKTQSESAGQPSHHLRPGALDLVQEILNVVVAQGFRSLTNSLHEDPTKGAPGDFALLDAILRSCLQVPDIDRIYAQVVNHFTEHNAARAAITLFTYGHQMTIDGDPIYGELSIRFLVELSTIPTMAEELAAEGLFSNISASGITQQYRRPAGTGPFDPQPRYFSIWAFGILPICVNLLDSVGRSLAPEISAFLNQFQPQLDRASQALANKYTAPTKSLLQRPAAGSITTGLASEANCLALISFMLESYRRAGASVGVDAHEINELAWDAKQVLEDIEELLTNREGLRSRLVVIDEKEVELLRLKPVDASSGAQNRLEERVVRELKGAVLCLGGGQE